MLTSFSRFVVKHQHGNVVELGCFAHKFVDICLQRRQKRGRLHGCVLVHKGQESVLAVQLVFCVGGLRHTVGVEEESVAGVQRQLTDPVANALHARQNKARAGLQIFKRAIRPLQQRRIVAGIGKLHLAGGQIQNAHPGGNEHAGFIVFAQLFVGLRKDLIHRQASFRQILNNGFGGHHKHRRRDSLAGNICRQESNGCIAKLIEIVEIAADLLGRDHLGINAVVFILGEVGGQSRQLDLLGILKLLVDACRRLCDIALQRGYRRVDIVRQGGELLIGANIHRHIQIALGDPAQGVVYLL